MAQLGIMGWIMKTWDLGGFGLGLRWEGMGDWV